MRCPDTGPCTTFSQHDIDYNKRSNPSFNSIRLSVMWAGAQPNASYVEYGIDAEFARRLRNMLKLCEDN
eukprot:3024521-Prymnesium_polylepis.1